MAPRASVCTGINGRGVVPLERGCQYVLTREYEHVVNGGVNRHTAHTCARRQRAASHLQTVFGERSKPFADKLLASEVSFGRKNFTSKTSLWQWFCFFSKLEKIPPQKCPKFLPGVGMGNFPRLSLEKNNQKYQRTLYVYSVNNPDIISQTIFHCGAIAKKSRYLEPFRVNTRGNFFLISKSLADSFLKMKMCVAAKSLRL